MMEQAVRYRPHKGSLADSMAEVVEFDGTRAGLIGVIRDELHEWPTAEILLDHPDAHLKVTPYYGDDDRIGWKDVHIVTLDGYGVLGFCEGPL